MAPGQLNSQKNIKGVKDKHKKSFPGYLLAKPENPEIRNKFVGIMEI